jgi:hypothetical protein
MRGAETDWKPPFEPMKALWLTLPGIAFFSAPAGIIVLGILEPYLGFLPGWSPPPIALVGTGIGAVLFILVGPWLSYSAYRYCSRSEGHDGLRRLLAILNLVATVLFAFIYACFFFAFMGPGSW